MIDVMATKEKFVGAKVLTIYFLWSYLQRATKLFSWFFQKAVYVLRSVESRRAYEAAMMALAAADKMSVTVPPNQTTITPHKINVPSATTSSQQSTAVTPQPTAVTPVLASLQLNEESMVIDDSSTQPASHNSTA